MLTTKQIIAKYGKPDQAGTYLVTIKLPFPMRIAWDTATTVKTMRVHKSQAEAVTAIFTDILAHYGLAKIKELLFSQMYSNLSKLKKNCAVITLKSRNILKISFTPNKNSYICTKAFFTWFASLLPKRDTTVSLFLCLCVNHVNAVSHLWFTPQPYILQGFTSK